jgi:putative transposase
MAEEQVFKGRHFDRSVILLCVRWYLAYKLSLRNLEEMMAERGISVDHATIHRWIVRYSPAFWTASTHVSELSRADGM